MSAHPNQTSQSGETPTFYAELPGDTHFYPTNNPLPGEEVVYYAELPGDTPALAHVKPNQPGQYPSSLSCNGPPQRTQSADVLAGSSLSNASMDGKSSTWTSSKTSMGLSRKLYEWGVKASVPINKLTNKLGSEAFWPSTMDKECDKAARILKSFCRDGFRTTTSSSPNHSRSSSPNRPATSRSRSPSPSSGGRSKALVKIPQSVVVNAKGLAIFTTFRSGFHISGAGGSGLVVARLPDGSWSPPAGFLVHTIGAGLMAGMDIYDCVCVLNTSAAVGAFTKPRVSLGGEIAVVAGPVGTGGNVELAFGKSVKPVWSYMKSRGLYGGVQVDGTVIAQRGDANAVFYGVDRISVDLILKGEVPSYDVEADTDVRGRKKDAGLVRWPEGARQLMNVLSVVEGKGVDEGVMEELGSQPTPGDLAPALEGGHQSQQLLDPNQGADMR